MYWENELRCPHCKAAQVDRDQWPRDEWRETRCEACGDPFKFLVELSPQYTTMTPALEAHRKQQAEETRRLMEKHNVEDEG